MSIITDALNKAQKRTSVTTGLRELEKRTGMGEGVRVTTRGVRPKIEAREGFFTSDARRLSEKKALWGLRSASGTLLIVGAVVLAFFYSTRFFSGALPPTPAMRENPSAVVAAPDKAAPAVKAPAGVKKIRQAERRPHPFELSGIIGGDEPMAIIDNSIVKIGESIRGARLVSVSSDRVTILYKGKEVVLKID